MRKNKSPSKSKSPSKTVDSRSILREISKRVDDFERQIQRCSIEVERAVRKAMYPLTGPTHADRIEKLDAYQKLTGKSGQQCAAEAGMSPSDFSQARHNKPRSAKYRRQFQEAR